MPLPYVDVMNTFPLCVSIMPLTIVSPSPVPSAFLSGLVSAWKNFSNNFGRSLSFIPLPVSVTVTLIPSFSAVAERVIVPLSVNLTALLSRLPTTCLNLP